MNRNSVGRYQAHKTVSGIRDCRKDTSKFSARNRARLNAIASAESKAIAMTAARTFRFEMYRLMIDGVNASLHYVNAEAEGSTSFAGFEDSTQRLLYCATEWPFILDAAAVGNLPIFIHGT